MRHLFDETAIHETAAHLAGSDDFGEAHYLAPLRVLLDSLQNEAALGSDGAFRASARIVGSLVKRAEVARALDRSPEVEQVPIERPIVITGLPRTGTTMLHHLLASDPDNRAPRLWEMQAPVPPPQADGAWERTQIALTDTLLRETYATAPQLERIHAMTATGPDECHWLLRSNFTSMVLPIQNYMPGYAAWLPRHDMVPAYRYHRSLLRLLLSRRPGGRLVLKDPGHLWHLDALSTVYPDALIVHLHRDPLEALPSLCSLSLTLQSLESRRADPLAVGRYCRDMVLDGLRRMTETRDTSAGDAFLDLQYRDLVRDPIATLRAIYARLGRSLSEAAERGVKAWLAGNPQHKSGKHQYHLSQFGLDRGETSELFGPYRERFLDRAPAEARPAPSAATARARAVPAFSSLVDEVRSRAAERGDAPSFTHVEDGGGETTLTFGELDRRARSLGAHLQGHGLEGERALLLFDAGLDFVTAFFGCLYGGVTAVPANPPRPGRLAKSLPRLRALAADAEPLAVLATSVLLEKMEPMFEEVPGLAKLRWIAVDACADRSADWRRPELDDETLAFLQYTSGSTGSPRGVMVSHGNLAHNVQSIRNAFGIASDDVCVSWLPAFHDMGLIGTILGPASLGVHCVRMAPVAFLQRPRLWLETVARFRATVTGGPNFAYDLCAKKIAPADRAGLDLSCLKVAFVGAEPVRAETLERFEEAFEANGFSKEAFFPCYGLAEATLLVSGGFLGSSASVVPVGAHALAAGRLDGPDEAETPRRLVACGPSVPDQRAVAVDPETLAPCEPGRVGEIWVAGPSVARGYWKQPEQSESTFQARLAETGEGPFLRTGDLGAVRDGQVVVTGRQKDLVIVRGANYYPQDIERVLEDAEGSSLRPGTAAAFSIEADGDERLVVLQEVKVRSVAGHEREAQALVDAIRASIAEQFEIAVYAVVLLRMGSIPKTSSGKVRRHACREAFLSGFEEEPARVIAEWRQEREPAALPEAWGAGPGAEVYRNRGEAFFKIDRRSTRYRFDLENDVAWNLLDEPGEYMGPRILAMCGVDVELLERTPGAYDLFQWALAIAICEDFVSLEENIVKFSTEVLHLAGPSRSMALFTEEEEKHVALFRRYSDHLCAQRPELGRRLRQQVAESVETAWWNVLDVSYYPSVAAFHYTTWLHFLFFEEYSIWLHEILRQEAGRVQPAWISAHAAHRQEEIQHVVTDLAHLEILNLSEAERAELSRTFLYVSAINPYQLLGMDESWKLCVEEYPELATMAHPCNIPRAERITRELALLGRMCAEGVYPRTCKIAPAFAALAAEHATAPRGAARARGNGAETAEDAGASPEARAERRLLEAVSVLVNVPASAIDVHQPLSHYGLDSLAAVELCTELEGWLGRPVPQSVVYDYPSIERLARYVVHGPSAEARSEEEIEEIPDPRPEVVLDPAIVPAGSDGAPSSRDAASVFVTGATGFLCSFLLRELLVRTPARALCLVRAQSRDEGLERLRASLEKYALWDESFAERIVPVPGDLAKPLLGLSEDAFSSLAAEVDAIYHAGAEVDFIRPYSALKAANVHGTEEVLRLACRAGGVEVNFVSTTAIFDTHDQRGVVVMREGDRPDGSSGFRNGYGQSKWVAEGLVLLAGERGLPVRVFRPGVVSGHSETGAWQIDMFACILKSYVQMGCAVAPFGASTLNAAPVDYVARAILELSRRPGTVGGVFHVTNPKPARWDEVLGWLPEDGRPLELVPYNEWRERLLGAIRASGDLALLPYYLYFKSRERPWQVRQPPVDCRSTLEASSGLDLTCPAFDRELFGVYRDYFVRQGFLAAPH